MPYFIEKKKEFLSGSALGGLLEMCTYPGKTWEDADHSLLLDHEPCYKQEVRAKVEIWTSHQSIEFVP